MIIGFEEETIKLSDIELLMAKRMIRAFKLRKGKENAITSTEIVRLMTARGFKITERRVRKIVNYLVVTDQVPDLIASGNGYYVASNDVERMEHAVSMGQRIAAMMVRLKKSPFAGEVIYGIKQLNCFAT